MIINKKSILFLLIGLVLIVIFTGWLSQGNYLVKKDNVSVVKIGLIAPLTGPGAVFGQSFLKGVEMAQKDLASTTRKSYQLVVEDDGGNPATAANAANKLINVDQVKAIITMTAAPGEAVKPFAENNHVPHINISVDSKIAEGNFNFTNLLLPEDEATFWVAEAKRRGVKKIAIFGQINPGVNVMVSALELKAKEAGLKIVAKESFSAEVRDFKTSILKADQAQADIFFVAAYPPMLDIIVEEMKNFKVDKPISSFAFLALATKPELFEGQWYTDPSLEDANFAQRFNLENPGTKFNIRSAPYGYDSLTIMVKGLEGGGEIQKYFRNLKSYQGKVGNIEKMGNRFISKPSIWVIKNGKPAILGT